MIATAAESQNNIALDNYTCQEFFSDLGASSDGSRLLRSMMMIAWATGYAAAQQRETARADANAIQLTAALIGDICRKDLHTQVAKVVSGFIDNLPAGGTNQPSKP